MRNNKSTAVKMVSIIDEPEDFHRHACHPSPLRLNELSATTAGANLIINHTENNYTRFKATHRLGSSFRLVNNHLANKFDQEIPSVGMLGNSTHIHKMKGNRSAEITSSLVINHTQRSATSQYPKKYNYRSNIPSLFRHDHLIILVALIFVSSLISYIESVPDTQFSSNLCPLSPCMCKWSNGKQDASCDRRNLATIPMQLPSETQVLDMSGNSLKELQPHIFQDRRLTNLQKLKLSDCKLSNIADDAFAHLTNLVELDLSHNHLQQIPTGALESLRHSLRKLVLAFNQVHVLDSATFSSLSHLNSLDLSHSQISQLKPNVFSGLKELRELKLTDNRLTQLPINVLADLRENTVLELYGNPWHCDCELRQSMVYMQKSQIQLNLHPTCASPLRHKDIRWQNIKSEEFMCPPVILNKPEEIVVGAGSNVTLACSARGSPPLTFVWFQDEKNMTVSTGAANQSEPPPSTKLLEERRYEIQEELSSPNITTSILFLMNLKLTDTSVFLCWVENASGYTLGNFSLVVNDSPPAHLNGMRSKDNAIDGLANSLGRFFGVESSQILMFMLALVLLLAAITVTIILSLMILKHARSSRSSKSSSQSKSDLKSQQIKGTMSSASKFNHSNGKANSNMFASSDEDGVTDEDDDDHSSTGASSSGSQSSCTKNNTRVLAANDLDGFIEHMRSGIINMDYHSMSPVIQFNNNNIKSSSHATQDQKQQHQLTHLNHFQSASNASSQQAFYCSQPSNGSNSMATTLSDLSPSSGSASTSFANANQIAVAPQQQQYFAATNMANHMIGHPAAMTNCDFQTHQLTSLQDISTNNAANHYPGYQAGYGEDQSARHMMAPVYTGPDLSGVYTQTHAQIAHNPSAMINHYPMAASMNGIRQGSSQNVVMQDMLNHNRLSNGSVQLQQQQHQPSGYQMQDSSGPFTHIL